jgi:hypothetical protein
MNGLLRYFFIITHQLSHSLSHTMATLADLIDEEDADEDSSTSRIVGGYV